MMIASVPGVPGNGPFGYVPQGLTAGIAGLGEVDTASNTSTLSVREYTLSNGAKVWASFQSPASDLAIKSMKTALARFTRVTGAAVQVDGLISTVTVTAVRAAAQYAIANGLAALGYLVQGASASPKTLAERAHVVGRLLNDIADQLSLGGPIATAPRPSSGGGGSHTQQPSTSPVPVPPVYDLPPDVYQNATPGFFGKKHWAYYAAGAVLLLGLGSAAYLVWKE
jgi:hypothetical protein